MQTPQALKEALPNCNTCAEQAIGNEAKRLLLTFMQDLQERRRPLTPLPFLSNWLAGLVSWQWLHSCSSTVGTRRGVLPYTPSMAPAQVQREQV